MVSDDLPVETGTVFGIGTVSGLILGLLLGNSAMGWIEAVADILTGRGSRMLLPERRKHRATRGW